jgi:hypothetical protein
VFPIIDVPDPRTFTVKIVAVVAGLQSAGAAYYFSKARASGQFLKVDDIGNHPTGIQCR